MSKAPSADNFGTRIWLQIAAVAAAYVLTGAPLLAESLLGYGVYLNPSSGVALVAVLLYGYRVLPGVWIGGALLAPWLIDANLLSSPVTTPESAVLIGGGGPDQLLGTPVLDRIHPDSREVARERMRIVTEECQPVPPLEEQFLRLDGTAIDVDVTTTCYQQERDTGVQVIARDITERKKAQDRIEAALHEKEVLLQEIYHRVKNNLQVIASLLRLQSRSVQDASASALLNDSAARVKSIALVHEQLYRSNNLSSIEVADDGIGFPPGIDFRASKSLGLQLVITLANQLQAEIRLERGRGSRIILLFRNSAERSLS